MLNWYEATEEQIQVSPSLLQERYAAYYNTFLATGEGRAVLFDLMKNAWQFEPLPKTPENAAMFMTLTHFIRDIKIKCGLADPMAVIMAEAEVAENYRPREEPENEIGINNV